MKCEATSIQHGTNFRPAENLYVQVYVQVSRSHGTTLAVPKIYTPSRTKVPYEKSKMSEKCQKSVRSILSAGRKFVRGHVCDRSLA